MAALYHRINSSPKFSPVVNSNTNKLSSTDTGDEYMYTRLRENPNLRIYSHYTKEQSHYTACSLLQYHIDHNSSMVHSGCTHAPFIGFKTLTPTTLLNSQSHSLVDHKFPTVFLLCQRSTVPSLDEPCLQSEKLYMATTCRPCSRQLLTTSDW